MAVVVKDVPQSLARRVSRTCPFCCLISDLAATSWSNILELQSFSPLLFSTLTRVPNACVEARKPFRLRQAVVVVKTFPKPSRLRPILYNTIRPGKFIGFARQSEADSLAFDNIVAVRRPTFADLHLRSFDRAHQNSSTHNAPPGFPFYCGGSCTALAQHFHNVFLLLLYLEIRMRAQTNTPFSRWHNINANDLHKFCIEHNSMNRCQD